MSENTKKFALIAVVIVAVVVAAFGAMRLFGEEKMQVENTVKMPEGYKSEKQRMLEEQQGKSSSEPIKDRDLGGDVSGG